MIGTQGISTSKGKTFMMEPSMYSLIVYKKVSGRDLFHDMAEMSKNQVDVAMMLDLLFSFCYTKDNSLDYQIFMSELPLDLINDDKFWEQLMDITIKAFGLDAGEAADSTPSE